MAFIINRKKMEEDRKDFKKETEVIPAGTNQARLVSYVELGKHIPYFQGKPAKFDDKSKRAGQQKDPELIIQLVFEFPRAKYTGDYPLTIKTSIPFGSGEFINKLSVSEAMLTGNISIGFANRSKYMKYLNAMNDACGTNYDSLADFLGEAFLIAVTHKVGNKADEDGNLPIYCNMTPDGIMSTKYIDQMDQQEKVADVPEAQGEYCTLFEWDAPTEEAWVNLPKYLKTCIKGAVDYPGSLVQAVVSKMPGAEEKQEPDTPVEHKGKAVQPEDDVPV